MGEEDLMVIRKNICDHYQQRRYQQKRLDILNGFESLSVGEHEHLVDVVDYFESKFSEIRDLLEVEELADLSNIEDAYIVASECESGLY